MPTPTRPRVGLLALMLELYDQSNPELRPRQEVWARELAGLLGEFAEVTFPGVCNTREAVGSALGAIKAADADLLVVVHLSYAPSLIALPGLLEHDRPIVLWNTQHLPTVGPDFGFDGLLENHGMHGQQDLANVLRRAGRPYYVATGHYRDGRVLEEVRDWARAATAVRGLRGLRIGLLGFAFPGMGDFGVDETGLLAALGPEVVRLPVAALLAAQQQAPAADVEAIVADDRQRFALDPDLTAEEHAASARVEWALRQVVREAGVGAIAVHYPALTEHPDLQTLPFAGIAKLMGEGLGFGGEGDVTSATATRLVSAACGVSSFTEMFTMDFEEGTAFFSHYAEANPALARTDQPVRLVRREGWVGSGGMSASLSFALQPGPATLLNLTGGPGGSLGAIVAEGEVTDYYQPLLPMPHFKLRPDADLRCFLDSYLLAGGSHHLALAPGRVAGLLTKCTQLAGLPCVVI